MDSGLKQRLIGAAVLIALGVIFLPMLVQGPAPDSGVSDIPLQMPDAPQGDYETRDLPLVTPGNAPDGGALGMNPAAEGDDAGRLPTVDTADADLASEALPLGEDAATEATPLPSSSPEAGAMLPAPAAGGDFAVHVGSFSSSAAANVVVNQLRSAQLPGYPETATVDGKSIWRVRIGPYASRADAEAARLRAARVRDDVNARVIALDDGDAAALADRAAPEASAPAPRPATGKPAENKPVETKPAESKPAPAKPADAAKPVATAPATAGIGFAVQLGAFSSTADANALRDRARAAGFTVFTEQVDTANGTLTRVRVGPVSSRAEADQLKGEVRAKLGMDGIVRPHP